MGYSFRIAARVLLYAPSHRQDSTAFVTPVMEHWLEREIAQWVHPMKDQSDDPSHHERMLVPQSYISLPFFKKMLLFFLFVFLKLLITILFFIFFLTFDNYLLPPDQADSVKVVWLPCLFGCTVFNFGVFQNEALLLNNSWPQFTSCFQSTVLVWAPCGWLWVALPFYLGYIASLREWTTLPVNVFNIARTVRQFVSYGKV